MTAFLWTVFIVNAAGVLAHVALLSLGHRRGIRQDLLTFVMATGMAVWAAILLAR